MAQFLPGIIIVLLLVIAVGFLVRGVFGPRAATAYRHGIGRTVAFVGHQIYRLVRWTLSRHWQFWLGVTTGVLVALYATGHLIIPSP